MKRNRILTLISISVLAVSMLSSCGKKEIKLKTPAVKTGDIKEAESTADTKEEDKSENESIKRNIPFEVVTERIEGEDTFKDDDNNENPFAYVMYTDYVLSDEMKDEYEELSRALTKYNKNNEEASLNYLADITDYAREAYEQDALFSSFYEETKTEVVRADDKIFSALDKGADWAGGVHPNSGYITLNIDTETGEELDINDVARMGNSDLCDNILKNLKAVYAEDGFEFADEDMEYMRSVIDDELEKGDIKFTLDNEKLKFYFSPYELQAYAVGPIQAELSLSEYKELVKDKYLSDKNEDIFDISYKEAPVRKIKEDELSKYGSSQGEDDEEYGKQYYIDNPDWDIYYLKDGIFDEMTKSPLTFKKVSEDKSDWLDEEAWAYKHGIELPASLFSEGYGDGTYYYRADNRADEGIFCLTVSYDETDDEIATFDLTDFLDTPTGNEFTTPYIRYAKAYDDVLYIEIGHSTYAEDQPYTSFIIAVDLFSGDLLWRSDMQVANGNNFIVGEDTIICGYGFTAEPDYIYVLSRKSGAVLDKIKVNSSPDYFIPEDDSLYVLCYNTAYEFNVTE